MQNTEIIVKPNDTETCELGRQVELIRQQQEREFQIGVYVSWAVLFFFLILAFSGLKIDLFGVEIKTIALDIGFITRSGPNIAEGIVVTIILSTASIALACLLALMGALGRLSRFPPAYATSTFYISLVRGTPLLLQIFFLFFALPQIGIRLGPMTAGILALGLNYGAYMAEIFRAGIQSVDIGQQEAAYALGMTRNQMMHRIIFPQALRLIIPPIGNQFIAMQKDSALVSTVGFVHEILWRAEKHGRRDARHLEALLVAAAFYWILTIIFSVFQSKIEDRLSKGVRE